VRPFPLPIRAARRDTLNAPVISTSASSPHDGASLLCTAATAHDGAASKLSLANALMRTGTMRPSGGDRTLGEADAPVITGGSVSVTTGVSR
jgi:hypothetical protein